MRIDMDTCEEILITITRNKTRSLLTAFGVFWGIFMLVALIGGGQGLEGMMKKNFEGFATNSGFLAAQKTGEAYKGFRKGRWWNLEAIDIERLRSQVKDVEVITFERGKEKRFFFIFIKFKINFSIKSRTFIIDAKLVNKECKLLTLFA